MNRMLGRADAVHDGGDAHAAGRADRDQPASAAIPRQDFRQRRDDASARRRGSTAERSGESV